MAKKTDSIELNNTADVDAAPTEAVNTPASGMGDANTDTVNTANPAESTAALQEVPALFTLDALADKHRVASWQQAALLRFTGWAVGKEVSEADYTAALKNLQYRRMGSGRA